MLVDGKRLHLTPNEFRLLSVLVKHAGKVMTHRQLLREVWGSAYSGQIEYVRVFVGRLRQKLGDDAEQQRFIQTVWNSGYRFVPTSEHATHK